MSFDKAYPNRKDWRKPYRGSARDDGTCRNHGSCPWCRGNRTWERRRKAAVARLALEEWARDADEEGR